MFRNHRVIAVLALSLALCVGIAHANGPTIYLPLVMRNAGPVHTPNPIFANLADNTALNLGEYTTNQLKTDCETHAIRITDYSRFTYDPLHHQMLMFGGGHASTPRTDVDVFNPNTLNWGSAYNSTPVSQMTTANLDTVTGLWISTGHPPANHTYDLLPFAPNVGELIMLQWPYVTGYCFQVSNPTLTNARIRHYNPVTKTWRASQATHTGIGEASQAEYDPVSGVIVILYGSELWTYDPLAEVKTLRVPGSYNLSLAIGYDNNLLYFPPNDKFYLINRAAPTQVFELTLNRSNWAASTLTEVTGMTNVPNGFDGVDTGFAYDSRNHLLGGGVSGGVFHAYDPLTKIWTAKVMVTQPAGLTVGTVASHALDYDPVNNVFIFLDNRARGHTWAYRYKK